MKIAYFYNNVINHGGVERILIDKANALAQLPGMEVWIVCLSGSDADVPAFPISSKVHVVHLGLDLKLTASLYRKPFTIMFQWLRWYQKIKRKVMEFKRNNSIDISISTLYDILLPYSAGKCPHIYESHADRASAEKLSNNPWFRRILTPWIIKKHTVVALTQDESAYWQDAKRVEIIPNFTNIQPVATYRPDTGRILATGRLDPQKGFDILVKAWSYVHKCMPELQLDIYGPDPSNGKNRAELEQQIKDSALTECVHLCGTTDNMPAVFAKHSAFVLSSRFEGFVLVLLEALKCGLPCVSFDCPSGPKDIIKNDSDGILVPFDGLSDEERAEKLAEAICRLMQLPDSERVKMSETAIENSHRFSRENIIKQWVELFQSLAK